MRWRNCITIFWLIFIQQICFAFVVDSTFLLGTDALEKEDYKEAKSLFSAFLQKSPTHQTARYNLALCYYHTKEYKLCIEELSKIPNWKNQPQNLSLASWCAYNQNLIDSSKTWLASISEKDKNAELILLEALLTPNENLEDRLVLLNKSLELNPGLLEALFFRAKSHLRAKDTMSAIQDLNVFLTHREKAEAYGLRAQIAKSHKDFSLAIKDFKAAFVSDSSVQWKYELIELYSQAGNYEAAFKNAQYIKASYPSEAENIQPIYKKLQHYFWLDAYWIYIAIGVVLILMLLYILFFRQ